MKSSLRNALIGALLVLLAFCCGLFASRLSLLLILAPLLAVAAFLLSYRIGRRTQTAHPFPHAAA